MNQIKGTPAYWKKIQGEILATVKQLGCPKYFLALSCADLRWNELMEIHSKLNSIGLSLQNIEHLHYFEHGTIIRAGITCKKIPCYMRDSACRWLILKMLKYFEVILNIFEFSHAKEIVEY